MARARLPTLSVADFIHRWQDTELSERAGAQTQFIELCQVLGQPPPIGRDQAGLEYTFEKGVHKVSGERGFADVWYRGHFAWEYKARGKDLEEAYRQLLTYREDLENPPLLVVSDFERFEVHTNFTGTVKRVYRFGLPQLADPTPLEGLEISALDVLRALFENPERLRPTTTVQRVTEDAAAEFGRLAERLQRRGADPHRVAHFLMRVLFCLFAEDVSLLPENLLTRLVERTQQRPEEFTRRLAQLFEAMASGGSFGVEDIPYFDGGLFADSEVLDLTRDDLRFLLRACYLDWGNIEPAIFGTLFERSLDPAKRSQLGAHYTSRQDILRVVEPVLMAPLRREWLRVQEEARAIVAERDAIATHLHDRRPGDQRRYDNRQRDLERLIGTFRDKIASVRVLDPACGSGNFLYVALKRLLDLENEVIGFGQAHGMSRSLPDVHPRQLHGLEINAYARELAQIAIWIGYIQWLHDNGHPYHDDPILQPLESVEERDAILAFNAEGDPVELEWPEADVIVGNPPFLGGKLLRTELGDPYVDALFRLYKGRVPYEADLVAYWFERALEQIGADKAQRAGLLATNSIRGGVNRKVLQRIKTAGDIFMAWSDEPWILDGAAVRISLVGFDGGAERARMLDGDVVAEINADLTATGFDLTTAHRLPENANLAFMGDTKGGSFDIDAEVAADMLAEPLNPNGRPNSDVVRPWVNGLDITRRPRGIWIIDFGTDMSEAQAALYEAPFEYVTEHVKPQRMKNNRAAYRERWWIHVEPRPALRSAIAPLPRYIATARVAKHRLFAWLEHPTLPDSQIIVTARADDYLFGVLHSRLHELWSLAMCSWLGVGNDPRYTPSTTFETFAFPWPPGQEPQDDPRVVAVAEAAAELVRLRDAWLNPPDAPGNVLKQRTLTNLYNADPPWLRLAHERLDHAVFDAYGWPRDLSDEEILERLLALNLSRASTQVEERERLSSTGASDGGT